MRNLISSLSLINPKPFMAHLPDGSVLYYICPGAICTAKFFTPGPRATYRERMAAVQTKLDGLERREAGVRARLEGAQRGEDLLALR